jgi:putative membrane protein
MRIRYHGDMKIIAHLIVTALLLLLVAQVIPGIQVKSFYIALISAVILGLLNLIVKPILVFFTLPITILTLGLFMFVINALLFLFAASFIDGFTVTGFFPALFGSIIVSIGSAIAGRLLD